VYRRYVVLTKKHLLTFKDEVSYKNPTEVIEMQSCHTVKTADDETYKPYSIKLDVGGGVTFYMYAESAS